MKAIGREDPFGHLMQLTDYIRDKRTNSTFMVAVRYGKGKVVGIGSWKIFLNEFINDISIDNKRFFKNIVIWLSSP